MTACTRIGDFISIGEAKPIIITEVRSDTEVVVRKATWWWRFWYRFVRRLVAP
jgi:hypothetical protein